MRKTITALTAALILTGALGTSAMAQYSVPSITRTQVARFDQGYLDQHPEVARQLAQDPRLIDNPQYRANHPGLDAYLSAHPAIRTELQRHPDRFMTAERRLDRVEDRAPRIVAHPVVRNYYRTHPFKFINWRNPIECNR
jgi:hypothetical protein